MTTTGPTTEATANSPTPPTGPHHTSTPDSSTRDTPAPHPPTPQTPVPGADLPLVWVERWTDTTGDGPRHRLRSDYVETFWLPVLGPSSVLFLRLLAAGLARTPGGYTLDLGEAARMLGIGHRGGRNGPMQRTIERCCAFGAARLDHGHQLLVRETLGSLGTRQLARLPESLRHRHAAALRASTPPPVGTEVEVLRSRCRTLALSLLELGEDPDEAEVQLHRWRFHPAMAHESVVWAAERMASQQGTGDHATAAWNVTGRSASGGSAAGGSAAGGSTTRARADGPGVSEVA